MSEQGTPEEESQTPLIPEDLSGLTAEELRTIHSELQERRDALGTDTVADVSQRRELRTAMNAVALAHKAFTEPEEEAVELAEPAIAEGDLADEVPDTPEGIETSEATEATETPEPALASVTSDQVTEGAQGDVSTSEEPPGVAPAVFQAAVGQDEHVAGAELGLEDLMGLYNAQIRMSRGEQDGSHRARLASVDRHIPGAVPEVGQSVDENTAILMEARANRVPSKEGQEAMVKTAALCGPPEIIREIPQCVSASRKVASKFPRVTSKYGHFQWFDEVSLQDVWANVDHWTDADQASVDETSRATWKQCLDLACPADPLTAKIHPIYHCLTVDVLKEFSAPEHLASTMNALSGAHARLAEGHLLHLIRDNSHIYSHAAGTGGYGPANQGALPTIVDGVAAVLAAAGFGGRLDLDVSGYEVWFPQPLEKLLFAEAFRNDGATHGGTEASAAIQAAFAGLGVGYDTFLDQATDETKTVSEGVELYPNALPAVGGAAVQLGLQANGAAFPTGFTAYVIAPDSGFYFEKPEINMGFERSPELARQNKSQMFQETFEGLGKQGCQPWFAIDFTLCFEGGRVGVEAPDCTQPV